MSGLAELLIKEKCIVSGSDSAHSKSTEHLQDLGATIYIGHKKENVQGADLIIFSAAILSDNVERMEGARLNLPEMERSTLLGQLMQGYKDAICISGTHGKTTVSSMIAEAMMHLNLDPTVHIGGKLDSMGGGMRIGKKDIFLAEACEFHASFLELRPTMAAILNIEEDHLDYYKDLADIEHAFQKFLALLDKEGTAFLNGDAENVKKLGAHLSQKVVTFGLQHTNDFYADSISFTDDYCAHFTVYHKQTRLTEVQLQVPGDFQISNALCAFAIVYTITQDAKGTAEGLGQFLGARRRFEKTGIIHGFTMYHDYGHNPTEMKNALKIAKEKHPHRVIAVMQPHTFSRVKSLFKDYLTCTKDADITLVTDIFAAREKDPLDIKAEMIVEGMNKNGIFAVHTKDFDAVEKYLLQNAQEGDLVLTMGCGNINLLNDQMNDHNCEN